MYVKLLNIKEYIVKKGIVYKKLLHSIFYIVVKSVKFYVDKITVYILLRFHEIIVKEIVNLHSL